MNIFFKEIRSSFELLDKKRTKQLSFVMAIEYMLKIANESKYQTESCFIGANEDGDIIIILTSKTAALKITVNDRISYTGKGPKKEDEICVINSEGYSVSQEVLTWIERNKK